MREDWTKTTPVQIGVVDLIRSGKSGKETAFPLVWRAVPDAGNGLPGVIGEGSSMGTIFQFRLTGQNIDQMLRDVERVVDQKRREDAARWG